MPYLFYNGIAATAFAGLGVSLSNALTNNFKLTFDGSPYFFGISCAISCGLAVMGYYALKARLDELRERKALQQTVAKGEEYRKDLIAYYQTTLRRNQLLRNVVGPDRFTAAGDLLPTYWDKEFWLPRSSLTISDRLNIVRTFVAKKTLDEKPTLEKALN